MTIKFRKKKYKQSYVLYTFLTAILLSVVFIIMTGYIYRTAENDAYENLHIQTKQIKDDISLQLLSDRENLLTMANFAAKLYSDGESYKIMFESFKPIGLIENIGILNSDNTFETKAGSINLKGLISFEEEKEKGTYISGRVVDLTRDNYEIIRSCVPIIVDGETIGILYGVIKLDKIGEKYSKMAQELNAQLFVYERETGNLVIDTVHDELGNISFLKDRKYNKNYSYEQIIESDKGFTSFMSAYRDENLHLHYSTMEDLGWVISFGRYDSQVFAATNTLLQVLLLVFFTMICIIGGYILLLMLSENRKKKVIECASEVRKELLETTDGQNNLLDALMLVCKFVKSRSSIFFDTNDDDYHYVSPEYKAVALTEKDRSELKEKLFEFARKQHEVSKATVVVMKIKSDEKFKHKNPHFYEFLVENKITEIVFAAVINKKSYITILGVINPKKSKSASMLAEKIAVCFSMALHNKNYLEKTEYTATTDSLTGTLNRVAYKKDSLEFAKEQPTDFSCIYIDVNELHLCNNKYGHAAGDQMLINIANIIKEKFYNQKVYRVGGDEFLIFCKNTPEESIKKDINILIENLKNRDYHVAIGMSYRKINMDTEELVREAEIKMYAEKARYYQNKQQRSALSSKEEKYIQKDMETIEINALLQGNYSGIYRVSLDTDVAKCILAPEYLKDKENDFSKLFSTYAEMVEPDYYRAVMNFMNYESLRRQLMEGKIPEITFNKNNGERISLSVHKLHDSDNEISDTLWIFTKGRRSRDKDESLPCTDDTVL